MRAEDRIFRVEDLRAVLGDAAPPDADYVIGGFVERASHVLLCGRGGKGKTMIVNQLCSGAFDLGISVKASRIVWLDGEMGHLGTRRRYWRTGLQQYIRPGCVEYVNIAGFHIAIPQHYEQLTALLEGADLVVIDSLRKICGGMDENASGDMSGVVQALTNLAHDLGPAILTIHHQGGDPHKWFRGSTAILDAADGLIGWLPRSFDEDDDGIRRLSAKGAWAKTRNDRAPDDHWFQQLENGLFVPADRPAEVDHSKYDSLLRAQLPFVGTKTKLAEACGTDLSNRAWIAAYKRLVDRDGDTHTLREEPAI